MSGSRLLLLVAVLASCDGATRDSAVPSVTPTHRTATDGPNAPTSAATVNGIPWTAATAEHLLNRAGFGAGPDEINAAVKAGLASTLERLISGARGPETLAGAPGELRGGVPLPPALIGDPAASGDWNAPPLLLDEQFYFDKGELHELTKTRGYCGRWLTSMVEASDPLRDRMALFWHGHFVSSTLEVGSSDNMIRQVEFLRTNALADFGLLVRGIARDPAMLEYLNNDLNVKRSPNENWARELMELFTLGEGNYTERDIKETARAFTGWTKRDETFWFTPEKHDYGMKTVLGVTGNLDGDDVIEILLDQHACAEFIAGKLIAYLEGPAPSAPRLAHYAAFLRDNGYRFDLFLRTLFSDPEFYRDEILGNRIAAPVEYFVGLARRLELDALPDMLYVVSGLAGQQLFAPPNVKGWDEGMAWLTTSAVMQRSNLTALLLGEFDRQFKPAAVRATVQAGNGRLFTGPRRDYYSMAGWLKRMKWTPALALGETLRPDGGDPSDAQLVASLLDRLLAVTASEERAIELTALAAELRAETGIDEASLLDDESSALLEELVHVILSLPEAQVL